MPPPRRSSLISGLAAQLARLHLLFKASARSAWCSTADDPCHFLVHATANPLRASTPSSAWRFSASIRTTSAERACTPPRSLP
eukprot:scaffold75_cov217-Pinguiococcus_pyrenoidosus.AAC.16